MLCRLSLRDQWYVGRKSHYTSESNEIKFRPQNKFDRNIASGVLKVNYERFYGVTTCSCSANLFLDALPLNFPERIKLNASLETLSILSIEKVGAHSVSLWREMLFA